MTHVFAHRGAKAVAPENTMPAFQLALDMGVDGIELDVQCSKDGALVVIHDFTVDRTTDRCGKVADLTLAELRELDAGSAFGPEFAGTRIPSLHDVLDLVGDRCIVNIEIKTLAYDGGDEADEVAQVIAERRLHGQVIVSSFNPMALIKLRNLDRNIPLGLLYSNQLPGYLMQAWLGPLMDPDALHPHHRLVDMAYMARARELGKAVNTWTVNEVEEAQRLAALGVDAIISDVPDAILAALASAWERTQ